MLRLPRLIQLPENNARRLDAVVPAANRTNQAEIVCTECTSVLISANLHVRDDDGFLAGVVVVKMMLRTSM